MSLAQGVCTFRLTCGRRSATLVGKSVAQVECNLRPDRSDIVEFYNLKTKERVEVPEHQLKKRRSRRTTSRGATQERYAAVAEVQGGGQPVTLFKFVNQATFDSLPVPEID